MEQNTSPSLEERVSLLEQQLSNLASGGAVQVEKKPEQVILIVFSQDLDKIFSALVIASSAATLGMKVKLFFTFWGINAIKKDRILSKKKLSEKMMSMMSPKSLKKLPISNLNMLGIGPKFLEFMMKEHKIVSPYDLMTLCREEGVEFYACEMTMNIMGITREELIEDVKGTGVTSIISETSSSNLTLFI